MKRAIALMLCLLMLLLAFAGCANEEDDENKDYGAYIYMYLTDPIYNFDPAYAYGNEAALRVVSLLFDNLFYIDEDGDVEESLVDDYEIDKEENTMLITLRDDTHWSDGTRVLADHVVYTWQRLLDSSSSFEAAALLYDVKNAKACKEGNVSSIDDVGIQPLNDTTLLIEFESKDVDYDNFIRNLASYALAPLRSEVIARTKLENDWAKSPNMMITSGPFRLKTLSYEPDDTKLILERNSYFRRDFMEDAVDESVTPYRIMIDYNMTDEEILTAYKEGKLFFVGDIPLSLRGRYTLDQWEDEMDAKITDALSTHSYVFNEKAVINGKKLFADKAVRNALSLAIDRNEIAKAIVFAEAANGLVPNGVFNSDSASDTFRDNDSDGLALSANMSAAKKKLSDAKINPSDYTFSISVAAYDDVHVKIADMVAKAWGKSGLGFNVSVKKIELVDNKDPSAVDAANEKTANIAIPGIKDDIFFENYYAGNYEVAAIDYTAFSVDAFSVLAPFAKGFTGGASVAPNSIKFTVATHASGFNSDAYNKKISAAFKEKDLDKRAKLLHEAEDILMSEMPIMPIIFNKSVMLESDELSSVDYDYFGSPIFTKTELSDYEKYIPEEEKAKNKETEAE